MKETFKQIIEKEGGIFKFNKFPHQTIATFFESIKAKFIFNHDFVKDIYRDSYSSFNVIFIDTMEIDASANTLTDIDGNKIDYIFIHVGLPYALLNIFLRMLSQPITFTNIGDHTKEFLNNNDLMKISDILENPDQITVFPKCKIREFYAVELAKYALDFIFCHELAHLYRGHCDYLNNNEKYTRLPHFSEISNIHEEKILLRQAIEFDADLIGMKICWHLMGSHDKLFSLLKKERLIEDLYSALFAIYESLAHAFKVLTISTYIFFRIFAENWNPKSNLFDNKGAKVHPDDVIRMIYILNDFIESQEPNIVHDDITVQCKETSAFFKNMIISFIEAEEGFALMQGEKVNHRRFLSVLLEHEQQFSNYVVDLLQKRNELIPYLIPFMRGSEFNN